MSSTTVSLSTLKSNRLDLCIDSLNLNQFSRTYAGSFSFNFVNALSGTVDFKNKNFTNFYLTDLNTLDKYVTFKSTRLRPSSIYTSLQFAKCTEGGNYLRFEENINTEYFEESNNFFDYKFFGATSFSQVQADSTTLFNIEFIDDFFCSVSYSKNNQVFYLVATDDTPVNGRIPVLFVSENKLNRDSRKIEYILTKSGNIQYLTFLANKNSVKYIIKKQGNKLIGQSFTSVENINELYINSTSAKIVFNQSTIVTNPLNTSFVEYTDTDYLVNTDRSSFDLKSNYLFYKNSEVPNSTFNIINLKNISDTYDSFTSSNNLLSSDNDLVFNNRIRNYTSIFNDIDSEEDSTLELNFVTYNLSYKITPGSNLFTSPSSINPFEKLNINDTKFVESGSFAFPYPYFADRVYKKLGNLPGTEGQYLCTWLSGAPGGNGIWVDRYYYPDLVSKADALNGKPLYNITYDDVIEGLIENNSSLKSSVTNKLFFDKKSDLTFEANKDYIYERINNVDVVKDELQTTYCDLRKENRYTPFYYKDINNNGGYSLAFKFYDKDFKIKTHYNDIKAGFEIERIGSNLSLSFSFFDNASNTYSNFNKAVLLPYLTNNDLYITFNNLTGVGRVYLNTVEIFKYEMLSFQFTNKQILFGDILLESDDFTGDILLANFTQVNTINDLFLSFSPLPVEDEIAIIYMRNINEINDLYISLPCGMRNFTDNIETLNTLGANLKSKSNVVDINIDNLNITDTGLLNEVKNNLLAEIGKNLPATTVINKINFKNFK